jgi:type IV pilus assembly protein PilP
MNGSEQTRIPMMKSIQVIIMLGAAIGVSACNSGDMTDLDDYIRQIKTREKGAIEPLPEFKTIESFVFDSNELRNPFIPAEGTEELAEIPAQNGIRPDALRPREELESYALDSLRMVGTVNMTSDLWGLIQANDGTIHRVRNGNYLGQHHGKIVRILENQIELLEIIPDGPGSWRERQASVKLSE